MKKKIKYYYYNLIKLKIFKRKIVKRYIFFEEKKKN